MGGPRGDRAHRLCEAPAVRGGCVPEGASSLRASRPDRYKPPRSVAAPRVRGAAPSGVRANLLGGGGTAGATSDERRRGPRLLPPVRVRATGSLHGEGPGVIAGRVLVTSPL